VCVCVGTRSSYNMYMMYCFSSIMWPSVIEVHFTSVLILKLDLSFYISL